MPGIFIAALLLAGRPEAAGIVGILTAIFFVLVALSALTARLPVATATGETELAAEVIADIESIPELELVESVPVAPESEVTLEARMVSGDCVHGYLNGDSWVIDGEGNLSRPICAAAAEGFKALYQASSGEGMPTEISCRCPLADRKVMFRLMAED